MHIIQSNYRKRSVDRVYRRFIKRILDFTICLCGLVVLAIPMLVIAVIIRLDSEGGAIFKQKRLGKNKKIITVYKFRTMVPNAYAIGGTRTYENDPRITRVGAFLRRTSLDETPQLWNILKGDMSIIGPRPILAEEEAEVDQPELYQDRYSVLPGLFCSVDLDYRATATRTTQFQMDQEYVQNMSFREDCRIFLGAIKPVVSGSNVYKEPAPETKEGDQEA